MPQNDVPTVALEAKSNQHQGWSEAYGLFRVAKVRGRVLRGLQEVREGV
jgi:hypothetical protein